ncbi:hypothetical protein Taro_054241 [Colocasia esculenta]|uniref:DUF7755 domain-containing protein n=1 Tax=Colocasia esculenta TaxID=4460 RepID=A0A843XQH8_COLES|nr:hypothetical protein [Colocasia esculenta]
MKGNPLSAVADVPIEMKVLASSISYPERCLFFNGLCKDGFAEPKRLLPITEAKHYTENMLEETLALFKVDESSSFYVLQIRTSSEFGSCLRDLNAAVLLSMIDINGDTVLQRISAVSSDKNFHRTGESESPSERIHFQRGSVDAITFLGPKLEKIEALWVGIESGSWRLNGLRLTIISTSKSSCGPDTTESPYDVLQYHFQSNDILFGEDGGTSMTELRPQLVKQLSLDELLTMNSDALYLESASSNTEVSADESMKEYTNLKLSLLVYDSLFIATGTAILALSTTNEAAYAFAAGGICGFLYLLLLQRSVDGLSASALPSANGNIEDLVRGFRGPLSSLALILAATAAAAKYGFGDTDLVLTPQYLFLGFAGFLICKLSVVLAAFKPLNSLKGNHQLARLVWHQIFEVPPMSAPSGAVLRRCARPVVYCGAALSRLLVPSSPLCTAARVSEPSGHAGQCGARAQTAAGSGPPPVRVSLTETAGRGVFATRPIGAGDLIHTASPVVAHPSTSLLHKVCYYCLRRRGGDDASALSGPSDTEHFFCSERCREQSKIQIGGTSLFT